MRLELTILAALAPQASVYTIPPSGHIGFPRAQLSSGEDSLDCLDRASLCYRHSRLRCHTADLNCTRLAGLKPCVYLRNLVRETGLEPVRPKTGDFKSPVATITPLSHIWYQELDSNQPHLVLQTSALPDELSWHCLVDDAGFEPATASVSRKYSTTEIIILISYCSVNYINTNTFRIISIAGTIPSNSYKSLACSKLVKCPCVRLVSCSFTFIVRNFFSFY